MPRIEVKGETGEVMQRLKSILESSGLEVLAETSDSLRFRKVRLTPSRKLPLSIYGSGVMRLESCGRGSTAVSYNLNISPVTIFSFLITGLSIVIFAASVDYLLLTSATAAANEATVDVLVVTIISSSVILVLILSFIATKKRAERYLRAFLGASHGARI